MRINDVGDTSILKELLSKAIKVTDLWKKLRMKREIVRKDRR